MTDNKVIKFNLIENAKDSLIHAIDHITSSANVTSGDYKRVILDIYQALELLLKEKVRRIHPAFVWENVDNYPSKSKNTISAMKALDRLSRFSDARISDEHCRTIDECRIIRNKVEHYEFEISEKEAEAIIGRMLSVIIWFSNDQLGIDLKGELIRDGKWKYLVEIYEFWEAHRKIVEDELLKSETPVWSCPYCGGDTYELAKQKCKLCGFNAPIVECAICHEEMILTETEDIFLDNRSEKATVCHGCLERIEETKD